MKFLIFTACLALASALPIDEKEVSHAPGGWHTIDTNTVSMLAAMHKMQVSFNMFDADSWLYHKVGKILSAESQVVSGIRYRVSFEFVPTSCNKTEVLLDELKRSACDATTTTKEAVQICQVTLHSQPWLDHLQSESFRCHLKPVTFAAVSEGEDHPAAGGKHKIDTNDESLRKTLTQVEFQLNERLQSPNFQRIGKVLEAESQVVSGVMYHVKFQVMDTLCAKATVTKDMDLGSKCPAVVTHKQTTCTAKIWSQPWLNHLELTEVSCSTVGPAVPFASTEDEPPKVPMPGGKVKIDSNDESLRKTLTQVESQLNERMNSMFIHRIGKVLEAESQVVSGVVYHVKFQLAQSKCLKSKVTKDTNLAAECPVDESVHGQTCTAKIWSQPWLNHLELSEIHCEA